MENKFSIKIEVKNNSDNKTEVTLFDSPFNKDYEIRLVPTNNNKLFYITDNPNIPDTYFLPIFNYYKFYIKGLLIETNKLSDSILSYDTIEKSCIELIHAIPNLVKTIKTCKLDSEFVHLYNDKLVYFNEYFQMPLEAGVYIKFNLNPKETVIFEFLVNNVTLIQNTPAYNTSRYIKDILDKECNDYSIDKISLTDNQLCIIDKLIFESFFAGCNSIKSDNQWYAEEYSNYKRKIK